MRSLARLAAGFVVLGLYRLCLQGGVWVAEEIVEVIGQNPIIIPLAFTFAMLTFGYLVRQYCRLIS